MVIFLHRKASEGLALVHMESLSHQNEGALWIDAASFGGQHGRKLISAPAVPVWAHTACPAPFYPVPASPEAPPCFQLQKSGATAVCPASHLWLDTEAFHWSCSCLGAPSCPASLAVPTIKEDWSVWEKQGLLTFYDPL